jgi:hypothetical protein
VAVTLLTLRGVAIEPLGVVRGAMPRRRRLLWRLALPLLGAALLYRLSGRGGVRGYWGEYEVAAGAVLTLVGLTALLPWLVESVVRRLGGRGPISWQLACRRLQLTPAPAARMVSGITVAVAGAIAAMSLFSGADLRYSTPTGQDPARAQMTAAVPLADGLTTAEVAAAFRRTRGVTGVLAVTQAWVADTRAMTAARAAYARTHDPEAFTDAARYEVTVADCATLRALARITGCRPGGVFAVRYEGSPVPRPGDRLDLNSGSGQTVPRGPARVWTVPATLRSGAAVTGADGIAVAGLLATPQALAPQELAGASAQVSLRLDRDDPTAFDRARNTGVRFDPRDPTMTLSAVSLPSRFTGLRRAALAGAAGTLVVIGAGLLISTLEQLRDRRRLLAVLVAFGTRRGHLLRSVLWQTAVPVVLGLALAVLGGVGLGGLLHAVAHDRLVLDWSGIALLAGASAGVVLVVTALSVPPLWRMMRPDGLRTE